jgi:hypothetical protein
MKVSNFTFFKERKNNCSQFTDCNTCVSSRDCGWCTSLNKCVDVTPNGSTPCGNFTCKYLSYQNCSGQFSIFSFSFWFFDWKELNDSLQFVLLQNNAGQIQIVLLVWKTVRIAVGVQVVSKMMLSGQTLSTIISKFSFCSDFVFSFKRNPSTNYKLQNNVKNFIFLTKSFLKTKAQFLCSGKIREWSLSLSTLA